MFLHQYPTIEIIAFKEPSFFNPVKYSDIVNALYASSISDDDKQDAKIKKLIANVNFGLLEKSNNKTQKSIIFSSLEAAKKSQEQYGGRISILRKFNEIDEEIIDPLGVDDTDFISKHSIEQTGNEIYILNVNDKAKLKNGFRYIKELLLQHSNFKMDYDYNTLIENGVEVFSVKTDAFTIRANQFYKAKKLLHFSSIIGGWRNSKTEDICFPSQPYTMKINHEINIPIHKFETVPLNDEFDVDEICNIFEKHKRVMVRADLPGSGKSFACEHMSKRGHKVLFVCPTNKLVQKYGVVGITVNKFFGMSMNDEVISKFDASEYIVIVFDEIYFSCIQKLAKINHYCKNNPDKIIIATGDTKQLPPITALSNQHEYSMYADQCINSIFSHEVFLMVNKRLTSDDDKIKLKKLKDDIFNIDIPVLDTIKQFGFKFTRDITKSLKNIAYMNDTASEVSKEVRKKIGRTKEYEKGENLICREYLKTKCHTFNVNFEFKIKKVFEISIIIQDCVSQEQYEVPIKLIRTHFNYAHCTTCHSAQGSTINQKITIFDYCHFFCSREWLWTAITRSTDLSKVYFFKYDEGVKLELNYNLALMYFNRKVSGYRAQDREAKREISKDNYVDKEWLMDNVSKCCGCCGCHFYLLFKDGNTYSNLTAQRLDNSSDHNLNNILPYCKKV
jgi:hypothetical protein